MPNNVFTAIGSWDTPVLNPGWTVQNALTGSNQNLCKSIGAPNSFSDMYYSNFLAQSSQTEDLAAAAVAATAGTAYGTKLYVLEEISTTYGVVYTGHVATTPTHGWLYLLDATGALWAATADQGSGGIWTATAGLQQGAWAGGPISIPPGQYYLVALMLGGTALTLYGQTASALNNMNLSAVAGSGAFRFATFGTGLAATLSTPVTMTGIVADSTLQLFGALL